MIFEVSSCFTILAVGVDLPFLRITSPSLYVPSKSSLNATRYPKIGSDKVMTDFVLSVTNPLPTVKETGLSKESFTSGVTLKKYVVFDAKFTTGLKLKFEKKSVSPIVVGLIGVGWFSISTSISAVWSFANTDGVPASSLVNSGSEVAFNALRLSASVVVPFVLWTILLSCIEPFLFLSATSTSVFCVRTVTDSAVITWVKATLNDRSIGTNIVPFSKSVSEYVVTSE